MVAAIAVAALGLVGCQTNIGAEKFIKGTASGAKVDYTNENENTIRNLHRTTARHSGGIWTITQTVHKNEAKGYGSTSGDGLMGIIFDMDKNDDGTWNFLVVGTGANNKKDLTYASYFVNISEDELDSKNFGCSKTKSTIDDARAEKGKGTPYEVLLLNDADLSLNILNANDKLYSTKEETNDTYSVKITVTPVMSSGSFTKNYEVKFWPATAELELDDNGQIVIKNSATAIRTLSLTNYLETAPANKEAFPQNLMGYYANIYAGQTLTGTWELGNGSRNMFNEAEEE